MNKLTNKKICVVTTSRAEYGLLRSLIKKIEADAELILQLVVGGSHLSPEFGNTISEIENDAFTIDEKVEFMLSSDSRVGAAKSTGLATISFADTLNRLDPDVLVLLGDRYETLAVALAAINLDIPIAHIHGGEISQGAIDDKVRHALTKLSAIHFPACERYAKRIIQMGEQPNNVYNYGAVGLDHLSEIEFLSKNELEESLGIKLSDQIFVCTYHAVTTQSDGGLEGLQSLLQSLESCPDATVIFTKANSDPLGRRINQQLEQFVSVDPDRLYLFDSLGIKRYMSLLNISNLVIGNSSSGLIEAPFLNVPTVNIGDRQLGRELASTVISCGNDSRSIVLAIERACSPGFRERSFSSPYGKGQVGVKIKDTLKRIDLKKVKNKKFYDCEVSNETSLCHS